jgi:hypothetical protein
MLLCPQQRDLLLAQQQILRACAADQHIPQHTAQVDLRTRLLAKHWPHHRGIKQLPKWVSPRHPAALTEERLPLHQRLVRDSVQYLLCTRVARLQLLLDALRMLPDAAAGAAALQHWVALNG